VCGLTQTRLMHLFLQGAYGKGTRSRPIYFCFVRRDSQACYRMKKKVEVFKGLGCRGAPLVSHLLFADDSLVLMKTDAPNAATVQKVLDMYFRKVSVSFLT
jgi:hypothetical protein